MGTADREAAMFHNAGPLFAIAQQARDRIPAADRVPKQYDAVIAVVFSVLSIEAMLTELYLMTRVSRCPLPPSVDTMATLLSEAEESRASLALKMHLFSHAIRGLAWDAGKDPYQSFARVVELRNALVHTKVDKIYETTIEPPSVMARLRSLNVLAEEEGSWVETIGTKAVAHWACASTSSMANAMVDALPAGEYRDGARVVFRQLLVGPN